MIFLLTIGTASTGVAFRIARRIAAQGKKIIILFMGDGCKIASDPHIIEGLDFARLYALKMDCRDPASGVELVDYDGWVKLLEYCNKTVSWV
jgi:predicted peroxiredoxin